MYYLEMKFVKKQKCFWALFKKDIVKCSSNIFAAV